MFIRSTHPNPNDSSNPVILGCQARDCRLIYFSLTKGMDTSQRGGEERKRKKEQKDTADAGMGVWMFGSLLSLPLTKKKKVKKSKENPRNGAY